MTAQSLNHFTIRPADVEATRDFYVQVLGLEVGDRPPFGFPGYWLYSGGQPIVHLIGEREGNPVYDAEPTDTRRLDHVCFRCDGLEDMRARLKKHKIPVEERPVPSLRQLQLFIKDPDGVALELNFVMPLGGK